MKKVQSLKKGWHSNVSDDIYHGDSRTVSSSGLRQLLNTPAHFKAYLQRDYTPSKALDIGKAVHTLVLERDTYPERFTVAPAINKRTKAGKEEWADFTDANEGKTILSAADNLIAQQCSAGMMSHPLADKLFQYGEAEVSGYCQDKETGVQYRIRPDCLIIDDNIIVDLKTSIDASPRGFKNSINKFGYAFQAAMYSAGFEAITGEPLQHFLFAVVEKTPPFAAAVYRLDETALAIGNKQYRKALALFARCQQSDTWPGYSDHIEDITLPDFVISQSLQDEQ